MKVGIFAQSDSWYAKDLQRAAQDRFEIHMLDFARLQTTLRSPAVRPTSPTAPHVDLDVNTICAGEISLHDFDICLIRTMPPGSLEQVVFRMDLLAQLATAGVTVINPPRSIEVAVDKYLTSQRLANAGLPIPATWVGHDAEAALLAFEQLGEDVVVKPLFGGEGRGIARINDRDLAYRAFRWLERHDEVIYLQAFVEHPGYDIRVFWLGSEPLAMKRINPFDWRTNVSRGATTEPHELTTPERELAWAAHQAVGAELSGVDLLPSKNGSVSILEVNAVPGWKRLAKTLQRDIAADVLRYAATRHQAAMNSSSAHELRLTPRELTT